MGIPVARVNAFVSDQEVFWQLFDDELEPVYPKMTFRNSEKSAKMITEVEARTQEALFTIISDGFLLANFTRWNGTLSSNASGFSDIGSILDEYFFIVDNCYEKIYKNMKAMDEFKLKLFGDR